jgi:SAM-dependent methyltransferase
METRSEGALSRPPNRRLNWGCGPCVARGWINADRLAAEGVDLVGDIQRGLRLDAGSVDYAVSIHVLQDLAFGDIPIALRELRRVLIPGGWLRLGLPDLDRALQAYLNGDRAYFYVPDSDARAIGAKLVTQLVWYGSVRTPMTFDCVEEWLRREGFSAVRRCDYGQTYSPYPEIVGLDNRPRESFFVEAMK